MAVDGGQVDRSLGHALALAVVGRFYDGCRTLKEDQSGGNPGVAAKLRVLGRTGSQWIIEPIGCWIRRVLWLHVLSYDTIHGVVTLPSRHPWKVAYISCDVGAYLNKSCGRSHRRAPCSGRDALH